MGDPRLPSYAPRSMPQPEGLVLVNMHMRRSRLMGRVGDVATDA